MSPHFPSRDELSAMNIDQLRSQIPQDQDDEKLLQEIIDSKFKINTLHARVYKDDIQVKMDELGARITPEIEAEFQKQVDEREAKIRKQAFGETAVLEQDIKKMEEEKEKLEAEIAPQAPELTDDEIKPEVAPEVTTEPSSDVKCELCGSKGYRHKVGCPTLN